MAVCRNCSHHRGIGGDYRQGRQVYADCCAACHGAELQVAAGIVGRDGKPKYGFHALRHACASLMIEQGWPVKKIQAVLGHSSIAMTMDVYGHLFTRAEDDVGLFEKLESDLMAA